MKPQMKFLSADCGCPPTVAAPADCPTPTAICDDRYYSLIIVPRLRILGVPLGTKCQAFLSNNPAFRGFVFDDGSGLGQYIEPAPQLTLPIWNPIAAEGPPPTYASPGPFPFLLAGIGGANPHPWRFVTGPGGVPAMLQWDGAGFKMVDIGTVPGVETVCAADLTAAKVKLMGCSLVGGVYVLRKLLAVNKRVVVGDIDVDGNANFKSLPADQALEHPLGIIESLTVEKFRQRNADDTPIVGGLPLRIAYGAGALVDAVRVEYSPSEERFFKAPPATQAFSSNSADVLVADDGQWNSMGGHAKVENVICNYPQIEVIASVRTRIEITGDPGTAGPKDWNMDYAFFVDGNEVFTFDLKGSQDNCVHRLITVTPGVHTIEVKVRKEAVAQQKLHIMSSNIDVFTVFA